MPHGVQPSIARRFYLSTYMLDLVFQNPRRNSVLEISQKEPRSTACEANAYQSISELDEAPRLCTEAVKFLRNPAKVHPVAFPRARFVTLMIKSCHSVEQAASRYPECVCLCTKSKLSHCHITG